jgi:formylglycine-generating enzyme
VILHRTALMLIILAVPIYETAAQPASVRAVPAGMVYVPGGVTRIGDARVPEERPVFDVRLRPFYMDVHPVTVGQFRRFVAATRYRTEAERFGSGAVYDPATDRWQLVAGATWQRPLGPSAPPAPSDHPVTQVSWNDAVAYARWAGKRLPTEVEWEHAARGAKNLRQPYAWGDSLVTKGRHRANTWQHDGLADGYLFTSPVGSFGKTPLGLVDVGGNVWEWTADWFRPYDERESLYTPTAASERVQRGGSFLCNPEFCHGYRVSARSHSTPESAMFHVGFRLVKDLSGPTR